MRKGDELFVYGTLRKGERADLCKSQNQFSVSFIGKDEINGKLYHLGAYPGLKLINPAQQTFDMALPSVIGEVFLVRDESVGALLDAYEGYPTLYERDQVLSKEGRLLWVYIYNPMVTEDQLIETGDWKNPRLQYTRRIPTLTVGRK